MLIITTAYMLMCITMFTVYLWIVFHDIYNTPHKVLSRVLNADRSVQSLHYLFGKRVPGHPRSGTWSFRGGDRRSASKAAEGWSVGGGAGL